MLGNSDVVREETLLAINQLSRLPGISVVW
jgi:hypothetical protein